MAFWFGLSRSVHSWLAIYLGADGVGVDVERVIRVCLSALLDDCGAAASVPVRPCCEVSAVGVCQVCEFRTLDKVR